MVTLPVVTVFPTLEPDTIPHRADEITATFAGHPALLLVSLFEMAMNRAAMVVF